MSRIILHLGDSGDITLNAAMTGKYAAKRVADFLGYDDSIAYEIFVHTESGPTRILDDEIMAPYHNYMVSGLKGQE